MQRSSTPKTSQEKALTYLHHIAAQTKERLNETDYVFKIQLKYGTSISSNKSPNSLSLKNLHQHDTSIHPDSLQRQKNIIKFLEQETIKSSIRRMYEDSLQEESFQNRDISNIDFKKEIKSLVDKLQEPLSKHTKKLAKQRAKQNNSHQNTQGSNFAQHRPSVTR